MSASVLYLLIRQILQMLTQLARDGGANVWCASSQSRALSSLRSATSG